MKASQDDVKTESDTFTRIKKLPPVRSHRKIEKQINHLLKHSSLLINGGGRLNAASGDENVIRVIKVIRDVAF